ncbi:uncharacterized protein [Brachyistius frenatus]|uniref:uncharacterized protein n=1 Tax=Brachyistius frenatus TaxID=100188 RepID=UPI0037E7A9D4
MEAVFGLLVMLLGVSHGVETHCDGRQDGAQCYGPLGGTVVLQLMDRASQIHKYELKKESTIILHGKQNEIITNSLKDRSVFTPSNGTFRINKLSRTDSSEYTLSIFDSNGTLTSKKTLHLSIQAPVSSVLVVSECLSQGEMKVSCSSEGGDSPQYSWTLGGRALTDTELYSENKEENSITLKQHVSGRVACKVWNHVSSVSKEEDIMNCGFIYINCISNGTNIKQWVFAANNTLCIQSTTVTSGVETHCDGRQDGSQCYGPLGGTVVLQLMDEASQIHRYELKKESTVILRGKQNEIITNSLKDRSVFTPSNGTFRINKLSRTDSSEYTLLIFDSNGTLTSKKTLHLSIQAPVSSVLMDSECLSQGEMKVSCSSEGGDSPQYSWTLGGRALTDAELYSENKEENSITLKQHVSGRVACKVWNHVSSVSKEEDIMNCGFIYINCISNGTNITQWVFAANNTLCIQSTTVTSGVETHCDGRQYAAQCYGPLGGTLVLQLMDEASQIHRYELKKESTIILRGRQNEIITNSNSLKDRSVFTPSNGTFRINKLSRTDSSEYTLSIFDSNGTLTSKKTLHLSIQAPVSSVLVASECLSQGEMKVSCSSEGGDSPQYSWTLGGRALTDAELYSENKEENSITLKQHVSGRVACKVWNHVSSVSKEEDIMNCGFIYINCISNGTNIKQWVFAANNNLCIQSTTVTVVKKTDIVSLTPSINITSFNETVTPGSDGPWYLSTDALPIMAGVLSVLVIVLVVGVAVTCAHKKRKTTNLKREKTTRK